MPTKHLFIINPGSGNADRAAERVEAIRGCMAPRGCDYQIVFTAHGGHAAELAAAHVADGADWRVYACGGDGTLNEVAGAAAGLSHVAVTHYPLGSGNDFIKIFGPGAARFDDLPALLDGRAVSFDLIDVNGRCALNIASVGFDARVAAEMSRFRRLGHIPAKRAYDLSVVYNLFRGIHRPYEVYIDGVRQPGHRFTLLVAANGRYYGGGYNPLPEAQPDDGQLDFLTAKSISVFTLARLIGKFAKGRHRDMPQVFTYARGRRMEIRCGRPEAVNLDGEILTAERVVFSLSPLKLRFLVPDGVSWCGDSFLCFEENRRKDELSGQIEN
ncbi:MAG: YegS/Rv2252/BmrU family lipid kinase [Oscillospiraceae bacterium]|jgi:YegS/Rv2252/BmrU family lipid kinase|nr:YegS/Rv2252/BmrU family lipid kinase [Oscillospiraceae bacterium]